MRFWLLALGGILVVGCAKPAPTLDERVAARVDPIGEASGDPAVSWDAVVATKQPEALAAGNLPALGRKLTLAARAKGAEQRMSAVNANIARFREVIPILAAKPAGAESAAELRMLLAENALMVNDFVLARESAEEVLAGAVNPDADSYGDAVHDMNLVLAAVARNSNNDAEARRRVLQAARTPGSVRLSTFGPRFPVVAQLYQAGDREVMLDYLRSMDKIWKSPLPKRWIAEIESGKTPDDGLWGLATRP